tara:strand:+ start:29949 stop:33929 length:3981 start_codon:yes stop_codon:yes gene_type:complete
MPTDYTTGDMTYSGVTQPSQLGHTPLDPTDSRAQLGTVVSQEAIQYSGIVPDDPRNYEQAYTWPTEGVSIQLRGIEVKTHEDKNQYNHLLEIFLVDGDKLYDVGGGEKRNLVTDITSGNQLRYFSTNTYNRENFMVHREVYRSNYDEGHRNFLAGPSHGTGNKFFTRPLYLSDDPLNDVPRRRGSRTVAGLYDDQLVNPEYPQVESGLIVNIPFPDMHLRVSQAPLMNSDGDDATYGSPALDHDGVNCGFNPQEVFGETTEEFSNDIKGPGQYLFIIRLGGDDPPTGRNRKRRDRSYYRCAFPKRLLHALITHPEYAGGMAQLMYGDWVADQTHNTEDWWNYRTAPPGIYPVDSTSPTGYAEIPDNPEAFADGWSWALDPPWLSPSAPYGNFYVDQYGLGTGDPQGCLRQYITNGQAANFTDNLHGVLFPNSEFEQKYFATDEWFDNAGSSTTGAGRDVRAWNLSTFEVVVTGPNDRAFRPWDAYPKNSETDEDSQEYSYVPMITPVQGIHSGQPIHQSFQQNLTPQKTVDYLTGIGTSRSQETVDPTAIAGLQPIEGPIGGDLPIYAGLVTVENITEQFINPQYDNGADGTAGIHAAEHEQNDPWNAIITSTGQESARRFCLNEGYTGWSEGNSTVRSFAASDPYYEYINGWNYETQDPGFGHNWSKITCISNAVEIPGVDSVGTLNAGAYCAATYGYNVSHTPDMATSIQTILPYTGDVVSNIAVGNGFDNPPVEGAVHEISCNDGAGNETSDYRCFGPSSFIDATNFESQLLPMYATDPSIDENNDFNANTLLANQDGVNTANQFCIDQGYIGADVNAPMSIIGSPAGTFEGDPAYDYATFLVDNEFYGTTWRHEWQSNLGMVDSVTGQYDPNVLPSVGIWLAIECIESATSPATQVSVWDGQSWEDPVWNTSQYYDSIGVWDRIVCEPYTDTDAGVDQPINGPEDIQDFTPTIDVYTGPGDPQAGMEEKISLQRYWDSTANPTEFRAATALNNIFVRVNLDDLDTGLDYTGLTYKFRVISWGDEENLSGLTDPEIDLQLYDEYDQISIREYPYEDVYWNDPDYVPAQTWVGQVWSGPSDTNEPIRGILTHAYREGGLKTIRGYVLSTMVDQRNPDYVQALKWKYFITKIYVSPPVYEVQDFGVLGGYEFTTLPFTDTRDAEAPIPTPIIGGLSDNSQYKKSITTLLESGEFASQDQDEIVALESALSMDEAGQHIGKTDFQQMRLFGDGTYDLDRLVGSDNEETTILSEKIYSTRDRDLKDKCLLELNPGEISAGSIIDSSGRGNIGIMIGDYGLEKDSAADPLTKNSNMLVPEIGTQDKAL